MSAPSCSGAVNIGQCPVSSPTIERSSVATSSAAQVWWSATIVARSVAGSSHVITVAGIVWRAASE